MPEKNVIEATYRITTPMFCSGADQRQAEFRLASFKGALRFWWRTLMWRETQDVAELRKRESKLFGSSESDYGQSKVRLRLREAELENEVAAGQIFAQGRLQGAHYLGYGVMEAFASRKKGTQAGQLTRPMLPGGVFTVACRLHPSLTDEECHQVQNALILLGTVGGIGSKARKGFGSLTLTRCSQNGKELSLPEEPAARLNSVLGQVAGLPQGEPQWTAWSAGSRVVTVRENDSGAWELLDSMGREQVHYRSWGNNGRVLNAESERNFPEDHDLSKGMATSIDYPKRAAFGLPHNYGKGPRLEVAPASNELNRRASPLFLHIHQLDDGAVPTGVLTFLPARFLPPGEQIRAFGRNAPVDKSGDFWTPVHGYLDRLIGKSGATSCKTAVAGREESLV